MTDFKPGKAPPPILHLHFDSDPASVEGIIELVSNAVFAEPPSEDDLATLEIIMAEVINNISEHAYGGRRDGAIDLCAWKLPGAVQFEFTDRGSPMPGGTLPRGEAQPLDGPAENLPEGGFGWYLIHTLSDDLGYRREGDENRLSLRIAFASMSAAADAGSGTGSDAGGAQGA